MGVSSTLSSILLLVLLQALQCTGQSTTRIAWKNGSSYPTYSVAVGDTARFVWSAAQNVYRHPSGSCDPTGSIQLAPTTSDGAYSYTFDATDEGTSVTFACQLDDHCENGMLITFNVGTVVRTTISEPHPASSFPPLANLPPAFHDLVEKTQQFGASGIPSALALPQPTSSSHLVPLSAGESAHRVDTMGDQTAVTFSCDLGIACPNGMVMKFSVGSTLQDGVSRAVGSCECVSHEEIIAATGNQISLQQLQAGDHLLLPRGVQIAGNRPSDARTIVRKPQIPQQAQAMETAFLRFQFTNSLQHLEVAEDHLLYRTEYPDIPVPARNISVGDALLHPYNLHGPAVRVVRIETVTREHQDLQTPNIVEDPFRQAQKELMNFVTAAFNPPAAQETSLDAVYNPMSSWCSNKSKNLLCVGMKGYAQHASRLVRWAQNQTILVQWTIFPMAFVLLSIIYSMEFLFYFGKSYSSPMLMFITLMTYAFLAMPTKYRVRVKKFKKY